MQTFVFFVKPKSFLIAAKMINVRKERLGLSIERSLNTCCSCILLLKNIYTVNCMQYGIDHGNIYTFN